MGGNVKKPRKQNNHFSLLFFEHQYFAYYKILATEFEVFYKYRHHYDLVNCVFLGLISRFIKYRNIRYKNNITVSRFFFMKQKPSPKYKTLRNSSLECSEDIFQTSRRDCLSFLKSSVTIKKT